MKLKNSLSMALLTTISSVISYRGSREEVCNAHAPQMTQKRETLENALREIDSYQFDPTATSGFEHDRVLTMTSALMRLGRINHPRRPSNSPWTTAAATR